VSPLARRAWAPVAYGVLAYLAFLVLLFPYGRLVQRLAAEHVPWPLTLQGVRVWPWGLSGTLVQLQWPDGYRLQARDWTLAPEWRSIWRRPLAFVVRAEVLKGSLQGRIVWLDGRLYPAGIALSGGSAAALGELIEPVLPAGVVPRGTLAATWRWDVHRDGPIRYSASWRDAAIDAGASRSTLDLGRIDLRGTASAGKSSGAVTSAGGDLAIHVQYRVQLAGRLMDSPLAGQGTLRLVGDLPAPWRGELPLKRGDELHIGLSGTIAAPRLAWLPGPAE
jgi:hypothetical protein